MMNASASKTGIELRLRAGFPAFSLETDLRLPGRGVTAIFGHSGSGKTTLLRCVAGLQRPEAALIRVNGETWQDDAGAAFVPVHQRRLGYVFQEAALFPHLDVRGNLEYGQRRRQITDTQSLDWMTSLLGIGDLLGRSTEKLSGGERQRVAIARALLADPQLLLMDEPMSSLDQERRREIFPYLEKLGSELSIPILYVTHSPEEVVRLAEHLVLLSKGRVEASGPVAETLARLDLPGNLHEDLGVLVEGKALSYQADYGLLPVLFSGGTLLIPHGKLTQGTRVRVQIKARDVSLSRMKPEETSILNLIPCVLEGQEILQGRAHVLLRLNAGGTVLLAQITRLSYDRLSLAPGCSLWAQIKSMALVSE